MIVARVTLHRPGAVITIVSDIKLNHCNAIAELPGSVGRAPGYGKQNADF